MPNDRRPQFALVRRFLSRLLASRSYGAVLLVAFLVVTGSFVLATLYSDASMRAVTESSENIVHDAVPSIVHLSIMQTRLHDLQHALVDGAAGGQLSTVLLDRSLSSLQSESHAFAELPKSPEEQKIFGETRAHLDEVRQDTQVVRDLLLRGDRRRAKAEIDGAFSSAVEATDDGIQALVQASAADVERAASRAEGARLQAQKIAYGLDGVSIAMAAILGVMSFSVMRRHEILIEERAAELEQFASRVAHDIRGPLTPALLAMQSVMRTLPPSQPVQRTLTRGVRSLRVVENIVDGLLAFARREGDAELLATTSVRETLDDVLTATQSFAAEENTTIMVKPFDDRIVACARGVLSSIVSNLIRNAIAYMGDSAVRRIELRVLETDETIRVEVSDTGPGLPRGLEKSVFDPYVRGRSDRPGLGLGLATVKKLAEGHGGKVGVLGRDPAGCTFWFELPRRT